MNICVIDTSALLTDTDLIKKLYSCKIIIHTIVIEELANLCNRKGVKGERARKVKNELFKIRNRGDFYNGIRLKHNTILQFDDRKPDTDLLRFGYDPGNKDNLLLCVARELQEETDQKVTLLTGDKFFLLKAGDDIKVEYVKQINNTAKKKKPRNKGYYNKGSELAIKRA